MYNLTLHIDYLLLHHDCVVVPGIGAFINERIPARYDSATGIWHPMWREVRFNGSLTHDDGLLAHSYARKLGVPFEEGRCTMRMAVAQMQAALDADGEVTVGNLGVIRRNEETRVFTPFRSGISSARMLGYEDALVSRKAAVAENVPAEQETVTTPVVAETDNPRRRFNTDRNYYIPVNKLFAKVAACFVVVVIAALTLMLPYNSNNVIDKASVLPVENLIPARTVQPEEAETPAAAPANAEDEAPKAAPATPAGRYHAIVATFNTPEEADKFVQQNSGCGYELRVVSTKTKSRVSALSASTAAELSKEMGNGDFKEKFSQAWIWESAN